jgi:arabinofuranosyltransferase
MFISDKSKMILGACILVLFFLLTVGSRQITFVDDAWITLRYSSNLTNHGELTFNIGERVEGISNLLWSVVLSLLSSVFSFSLPMITVHTSLLLIALSLFLLWRIGIFVGLDPIVSTIPPLFLLLTPSFYRSATNGLELPLFTVLLVASGYVYLQGKYPLAMVFLGLLFLTRIESIAIGAIFLVFIWLKERSADKKNLILSGAIYIGIVVSATLFRVLYYSDFIPNSVRVKQVPLSSQLILSGIRYVLSFISEHPLYFILFIVTVFIVILDFVSHFKEGGFGSLLNDNLFQIQLISALGILFSFVVVVRNGGDWMPDFRLFFGYATFYALMFIALIKRKVIHSIFAVGILVGPLISMTDAAVYRFRHEENISLADFSPRMSFWGEAVDRLSGNLPASSIVSAEAIGYIGYYLPETFIHDPLGLADRYIADYGKAAVPFGRTDIDYTVNSINPQIMIWHYFGHLRNLDYTAIDASYTIYCYDSCDGWGADVVMVRYDLDLSEQFSDWETITISQQP